MSFIWGQITVDFIKQKIFKKAFQMPHLSEEHYMLSEQ